MLNIHYQLTFDDFLIYQKKYFDLQINPAIKDSLAAWKKFLFYLQVFICLCVLFIFNLLTATLLFCGLMLLYGCLIYTKQLPKLYWQFIMKKNNNAYLLKNIFQGDKNLLFSRVIEISESGLELKTENKTTFYLWENIQYDQKEQDDVFLFFSDYEGTIIPLKQLTNSEKEMLYQILNKYCT